MGKPKPKPKNGQFGTVRTQINFPSMMIVDPLHLFTAIFGGECGMGQGVKSGGTHLCEHKRTVTIKERKGAAYCFVVNCANEAHCLDFWTSGQDSSKLFDVNKSVAIAGRITGLKFQKTREFVAAIGSPMQSERSYNGAVDRIAAACSTNADKSKQRAAVNLREGMGITKWTGEISNVVLTCDCTWLTRGQKSRHGVATGLSAVTHLVLDTEVESSYCTVCSSQSMPDPALVHACQITHKGSAGSMEVAGLKKIFERAPELLKFRYTTVVRDEDSKTYEVVKSIYGPEVGTVISLADKNHAKKAFYKRLKEGRKGARTADGQKITGAKKVTEDFIEVLASYFRLAVQRTAKAGGSADELQAAIWRIYFHKTGDHSMCSDAQWCSYQKASKEGTLASYVQTGAVLPKFLEPLKHVFEDVTKPDYLNRLLHNYSTSPNEAFHSVQSTRLKCVT